MSIVSFQQTIASERETETMFPPDAPSFLKTWGTSRFPTRLHAHSPKAGL